MEVHTVPSPSVGAREFFVALTVDDLYRDDLRLTVPQGVNRHRAEVSCWL